MKTITVYLEKCHQNPDFTKEMNEWFGQLNSYYALWDRKIELTDSPDASIVLDSSVGVDILKVLAVLSFENLENTDSYLRGEPCEPWVLAATGSPQRGE